MPEITFVSEETFNLVIIANERHFDVCMNADSYQSAVGDLAEYRLAVPSRLKQNLQGGFGSTGS
jgi:hypothetical protein